MDEVLYPYTLTPDGISRLIAALKKLPIPPRDRKKALQTAARKAGLPITKAQYAEATGTPQP